MRGVNFEVNDMATERKLIILMVREGNECDLESRIDMTTESTITPTYPSLCLYQSRRWCFVGVGSGKKARGCWSTLVVCRFQARAVS